MIADLKPYPEYKESGLPWLGQVPAHWGLSRSKRLLSARKDFALPEDVQLSATQAYGVIPQSDFEEKVGRRVVKISMHLEKRRHVEKNDFVISMRSFQGGIERAWASGAIRSSYVVLKPASGVDVGFFSYLFKSHSYIRALQATADFIRDGQDLNFSNFCGVDLPIVPLPEQAAIARFLDWANGRLERAIRAKRKELALISEMLSVAMERALQLKGARRLRLSTVAEVVSRPIARRATETYTRIGLYNRGRGLFHKAAVEGAQLGDSDFFWIEEGDFVISGQFAWEGAVALARPRDSGCVASHRYPILRGREEYISSAVLFAFFRTAYGSMLLDHHSRGAAGRNRPLNAARLLKEIVPIPSVADQARITELLEEEYAVSQSLARTVHLIREYRTRLVADVVTGKLDVREAAARLPELPADVPTDLAAATLDGAGDLDETDAEES